MTLAAPSTLDLVTRLRDILVREQQALEHNDVAALEESSAAKRAALHALAPAGPGGTANIDADCQRVIDECRRLNAANGATIELRRRLVEATLALITGQDQRVDVYDAAGSSAAVGYRNSLGRV